MPARASISATRSSSSTAARAIARAEIARAAGALVVENPWPGFAAQRNVALDHASGDWVLEIDADERVSPDLGAEIRRMLADPPGEEIRMAALPMRDVFLGRPLGPSARYPRYRHRLFRREAFRHDESRTVHEGLWPDGPVLPLDGELEHLLATTWREALDDAIAYARLESRQHGRPGPLGVLRGRCCDRPPSSPTAPCSTAAGATASAAWARSGSSAPPIRWRRCTGCAADPASAAAFTAPSPHGSARCAWSASASVPRVGRGSPPGWARRRRPEPTSR